MSIPDASEQRHVFSTIEASPDGCAAAVFDTMPLVMRSIKREMQEKQATDLSIQQFRALKFIQQNQGAHLSRLTEHLGGTLSAVSKLVDGLVERSLIEREPAIDDRRRINLRLRPEGAEAIERVKATAVATLDSFLQPLSATERSLITLAMHTLRSALERRSACAAGSPARSEESIA